MKRKLVLLATDQVTKAGIRMPASELMRGVEKHFEDRIKTGLPSGFLSYIQHDMHRPLGWMSILGHVIDGAMVQMRGLLHEVETDDEKADLSTCISAFWDHFHHEGMQANREDLVRRVSPSNIDNGTYLRIEAYVVSRTNLAAELYPDLFNDGSDLVDKDGLTDYRALTKRMQQVQPGVFLDTARGLLLFAHRYFRRSFSHWNKLNDYFLNSFETAARDLDSVRPRLRLDPDLIGHPQTAENLMEQEFWRGPRFDDDISSIPSGVAELKAEELHRYTEGVDKTQVWWKSPETRRQDDTVVEYRTFEIEELVENEAAGLGSDSFGCRYAHSEYSSTSGDITHFDGAIRAYPAELYLDRIETSIDHAGKRSDYTKLFRFDGPMPVSRWKRLLSDFFRGNPLVPEYFGAPAVDVQQPTAPQPNESVTTEPDLCAMVALEALGTSKDWDHIQRFMPVPEVVRFMLAPEVVRFMLAPEVMALPSGQSVHTFEIGHAAIEQFFRSKFAFNDAILIGSSDGRLNLPRMIFGDTPEFPQYMSHVVAGLASALRDDIENNRITGVAVALTWQYDGLLTTLSIRGVADLVERVLGCLFNVVDVTKAASEWIEPLSQLIKELAPTRLPTTNLTGILEQRLLYEHSYDAPVPMRVGESVAQTLASTGIAESGISLRAALTSSTACSGLVPISWPRRAG
ncbi:hypothetical protein [Komagataeibacter oboediens]|uniref:hypothetical protein n=1 Tax=Komagataeibacter oboediens TaxID=65958 RepID=UPI001C2D7CA1|nr:hypothetical protein [Komagataeibacter oboediens]MBV1825576.1 hypothetical protein [Komagataeibacter oboediens]